MSNDAQSIDVITRIKAAYPSLSHSQQKVADFILSHAIEVVYLSAARIAEQLQVNGSTVVRTAQTLGYEGFRELQIDLQAQLLEGINAIEGLPLDAQKGSVPQDDDSVFVRVLRTEIDNVEGLLEQISREDFDKAVDLLAEARRIYIIGLRASFPVAQNFATLLHFIRTDVILLEGGAKILADQMEQISAEDALVSISYARYVQDTLQCIEFAQKAGARIITVTDDQAAPAAHHADILFVIPFRLMWYGHSIALFALFNVLFVALFLREPNVTRQRLDRLTDIYRHFGVFASENEAAAGKRRMPKK